METTFHSKMEFNTSLQYTQYDGIFESIISFSEYLMIEIGHMWLFKFECLFIENQPITISRTMVSG